MINKTLLAMALTFTATTTLANTMDHSKMDHGNMSQSEMSEKMDHSMMNMDHSQMMAVDGMSEVGMPAPGSKANKVVHVILSDDMKITFKKEVTIEPNDVVQFVVINTGKIDHEFSIGSAAEQLKHRAMMRQMGNHQHDSGSTVTVQPGKAKQLLWHFQGDHKVEFACNIPGHAEAGMIKQMEL